jgi:hypothetical protein
MEKINEILGNIEKSLAQDPKIDLLEKLSTDLKALAGLIIQVAEKKKDITGATAGKEAAFNFQEYFTTVSAEITKINEKFANLIEITQKLETDRALKQFLLQKLNEIFENITNEAARQFNLSTLEIFNEFVGDLKKEMEQKLIDRIEKELFSIQTELGNFEKVYDLVAPQFTGIQESITGMKQKYLDQYQVQVKYLRLQSELIDNLFPQITSATKSLAQNIATLQTDVGAKLSAFRQAPLQLLPPLRSALKAYDASHSSLQSQSADSLKAIEEMRRENARMKAELENVYNELGKVSKDFEHLAKQRDQKVSMQEVLALVMTLLVEVFGAQPHSKLLYLLHGQKTDMDRDTLTKASGIAGAIVRKALADLDAAKLVKYDVTTGRVTLLKRVYQ